MVTDSEEFNITMTDMDMKKNSSHLLRAAHKAIWIHTNQPTVTTRTQTSTQRFFKLWFRFSVFLSFESLMCIKLKETNHIQS